MVKRLTCAMILIVLLLNLIFPILSIANENNDKIIYINSENELWDFAQRVNNGESFAEYTINLTNDIQLHCSESKQWIPIGKYEKPFKGIFNGHGHIISGMSIYHNNDESEFGLFGRIENAKISNVVTNGSIACDYKAIYISTNKIRPSCVGGIVAISLNSRIEGCTSNVTINCTKNNSDVFGWEVGGIVGETSKSIVSNCINNGNIYCQSSSSKIGGICGYNWSSIIEKSINNAEIETREAYYTGGIVGEMYYINAKIERCFNNGKIKLQSVPQGAGGIAGEANVGEFKFCFNKGDIEYLGSSTSNGTASIYNIGGITGRTYNNVTIKNCYNIGQTGTGGGIAGRISSDNRQIITNNYYLDEKSNYGYYDSGIEGVEALAKNLSQMKTQEFVETINNENNVYRFDENNNNDGYPILLWVNEIEINQLPDKLLYKQNIDDLNLTGGKIKIKYNYGYYDTIIDMSNNLISVNGFSNSEEGTIKLDIVYTDEFGEEFKKVFECEIVETIPPELSVEYSTTQITNQDVTVTITANEKIQQVEGWAISSDLKTLSKIFTENGEETVIITDLAGNTNSINVSVNNINKSEIEAEVEYSTTLITNQDVTVNIITNKRVLEVSGWTISEDGKMLSKTFENNSEEELIIYDEAGNSKVINVSINNIDKINPEVEIKYSIIELTNKDVTVTVSANENIQQVESWSLKDDGKTLSKMYSINKNEKLIVKDLAGNSVELSINVNNIDKNPPKLNIEYSTVEKTTGSVKVTIKADEEIQEIEGWTLNEEQNIITREFNENTIEQIIVYDLVGNGTAQEININNITDKTIFTQTEDKTVAPTILPQTGEDFIIIFIGIFTTILISMIMYKKYKNYKNIK